MTDQARKAADSAEFEARDCEDSRFAAVVIPLVEAVRILAGEIDRHDRWQDIHRPAEEQS